MMSTPSSITWLSSNGRKITFKGEWTLEPKFYLSVPKKLKWDDEEEAPEMSQNEANIALNEFLRETKEKGWEIVVLDESA